MTAPAAGSNAPPLDISAEPRPSCEQRRDVARSRVMRLLLGLTFGVSAAIALAPLAQGDPVTPNGDEAGFLSSLRGAGISYSTPEAAITFAKSVCVSLGDGEVGPQMVDELKSQNPGLTNDQAASFLAIAAKYYCPQRINHA